jgi:hypothetical protein
MFVISGTPGNDIATNSSPTTATASNRRSTTSDPNDPTIVIFSIFEKAYARANSPMRAGSTLFPMNPMVVAA